MKRRRHCPRMRWMSLLAALGLLAGSTVIPAAAPRTVEGDYLAGQLLVATPKLRDPRFARTVIFMIFHDDHGAMGLIVNRPLAMASVNELLRKLQGGEDNKKEGAERGRRVRMNYGGPVGPRRLFFLHSNDYQGEGTKVVTDNISMTSHKDILLALARDGGPQQIFLAIGYAAWGPGQLEWEIRSESWVSVYSGDALVFDDDMASKWQRAFDKRGRNL